MSEYYDLPYTGAEVAADLAKLHDKESLVEDAPTDGVSYAQSNGEWAESSVDQLGTALDAIKGDETGDDLVGKLKEIVTSKQLIKKALIDADVENVGDVLSAYADMIRALADEQWLDISCKDSGGADSYVFNNANVISKLSYIRVTGNPYYLFYATTAWLQIEQADHIKFVDATTLNKILYKNTVLKKLSDSSAPLATNASCMFQYCRALTDVSGLELPNVTDASCMFDDCSALTDVSGLELPNVTNASCMFQYCSALTTVSGLELPNVTDASCMFDDCSALTDVSGLELPNVTDASYMFDDCTALRYLLIKNVGKSSMTSWDFSGATNWGVEDETIPLSSGARQSLIDTLITYSYDRATAGMSACTITLSDTTMALLTDTEIAQITAKGFTLS